MLPKRYLPSANWARGGLHPELGPSGHFRNPERPDHRHRRRRPGGRSRGQPFAPSAGRAPRGIATRCQVQSRPSVIGWASRSDAWYPVPPLKRFLPRALRDASKWSLKYQKTILSIPIFHLKKYLPENFKNALGSTSWTPKLLQEPSEVKISCSDLKTRLGAKAPALV